MDDLVRQGDAPAKVIMKRFAVMPDGTEVALPYTRAQHEWDRKSPGEQAQFYNDGLKMQIRLLTEQLRTEPGRATSMGKVNAELMNSMHRLAVPTVEALEHKIARMYRALQAYGMPADRIANL